MVGDVRDVITCAEFQIEIFMGYDYTGGRIYRLPAIAAILFCCPTADLSNIRPSQWSGLFDQWAVEHAPDDKT